MTYKTILYNNSDSSHPGCSWFWRKCFQVFTIKNNVCCEIVIHELYYVEVGSFWSLFSGKCPFSGEFFFFLIINWCWILSKNFLCTYWDYHMIFIFQFVNIIYKIVWFAYREKFTHSGINSTWTWCVILLCSIVCHFIFFLLVFCSRFLHLCSSMILAFYFLFCVVFLLALVSLWWQFHRMGFRVSSCLQFLKNFDKDGC